MKPYKIMRSKFPFPTRYKLVGVLPVVKVPLRFFGVVHTPKKPTVELHG